MPNSSQHIPASLIIPAGASATNARSTGRASRGSFQCPAALTGTTLTFQVSNDTVAANFSACPVEGNETAAVTFSANVSFSMPVKLYNFSYFRLLSNGTEAVARTIPVFSRE